MLSVFVVSSHWAPLENKAINISGILSTLNLTFCCLLESTPYAVLWEVDGFVWASSSVTHVPCLAQDLLKIPSSLTTELEHYKP